MKFFKYNYSIVNINPYFSFKFVIFNKKCFRLFHFHLGYKDVSLLWILKGKIKDLLFKQIN